jgi:hypothetical protein
MIEQPHGFPENWTQETIEMGNQVQFIMRRGKSDVYKTTLGSLADARAELRAAMPQIRAYAQAWGDRVS